MCGICGIYNYKTEVEVKKEILIKMNNSLFHRGPDDEGFYINKEIGLGMRRLSIIDLNTGSQPIFNETNNIITIFNGEIYNYIELRGALTKKGHVFKTKSDTEVIVHLYEEYKDDFVHQLNGMFSIALYDKENKKLLLIRDRFGEKPLFYFENEDGIYFCSEINGLLETNKISRDNIDLKGLHYYLSYYYFPLYHTIYKQIKRVPPGSMLIINKNLQTKKYWDLNYDTIKVKDTNFYLEKIKYLLEDSCKLRLRSDVTLGIFLSGGLDSTLITAITQRMVEKPLKTYTLKFKEKSYDESEIAKLTAEHIGTEHYEFLIEPKIFINNLPLIIKYAGQPHGNWSIVLKYLVSKFAKKDVTVVLTGEGGDEMFAGYPTISAYLISQKFKKIHPAFWKKILWLISKIPASDNYLSFEFKLKKTIKGILLNDYENYFSYKEIFSIEEIKGLIKKDFIIEKYQPAEVFDYFANLKPALDIINKLLYFDTNIFMEACVLFESDISSMITSLEARTPMLDYRLAEFLASVPSELKCSQFQTKLILRKLAKEYLPAKILKLKKRGFVAPISGWLKNELKQFVLEVLSENNINKTKILNYSYVMKILNEHFNSKVDNTRKICALISFVIWKNNLC
ncbi:MAG TPA: asparagine synthase (glutamine-hydrolyzing) [bacterium]|nr:asparagine synthase (glutamine-hydrolyzing) [bacterium]